MRTPSKFCSKGHEKTGDNAVQIYYKGNKDGVRCRICQKETLRKNHILRTYGLTWEQYQSLLESQSGRCALCESDSPGGMGDWHVDHDHKTGKVRALLCSNCNTCLGKANDDPSLLRKMANYLEA